MEFKKCNKCGKELPLSDFYFHHKRNTQYNECKSCWSKGTKNWRQKNKRKCAEFTKKYRQKLKEKMSEKEWSDFHREINLMSKFNISPEEYNIIFEEQYGLCAICGKKETATRLGKIKKLAIDHDHETGQIRGLLCQRCNMAIGLFDEDTNKLKNAIKYLSYKKLY